MIYLIIGKGAFQARVVHEESIDYNLQGCSFWCGRSILLMLKTNIILGQILFERRGMMQHVFVDSSSWARNLSAQIDSPNLTQNVNYGFFDGKRSGITIIITVECSRLRNKSKMFNMLRRILFSKPSKLCS